ncbi:hypothetical protein EV424DRAFT_1351688 [Suillus variegatus]|nr:hypothetical protein EV424DRAFT_1351688 [Suillus variegatus]
MVASSVTDEDYGPVNGADADADIWTNKDLLIFLGDEPSSPESSQDPMVKIHDGCLPPHKKCRTQKAEANQFRTKLRSMMGRLVQKAQVSQVEFSSFKFHDAVKEWAHRHLTPPHWNQSMENLLSADGVPLVLHIPNAINERGREALYQSVMQFGMAVPLKMGKGADKKGRDQEESYHVVEGQLAGNVKLVSAWHAVGQQNKEPVISADVISSARQFSLSTQLVSDLELLNLRVNALLEFVDPPQFLAMTKFAVALRNKYVHVKAWSVIDGLLWEDSTDPPQCWVALVALGTFKGGHLFIPRLNLRLWYEPGTIILLCGHILPHVVEAFFDGQRVSIAHFTHESLWKALGLSLP